MSRILTLALRHDHSPAFQASFLVLTFLAAALLNIGAFMVLVTLHMILDVIKYRGLHGKTWADALGATVRESLLDIVLLSLALFLTVYFHESAGLIAVSAFFRFEAMLLARLASVLARMEVLVHVFKVFTRVHAHVQKIHRGIAGRWTLLERLALAGAIACLVLVSAAPFLSENPDAVMRVLTRHVVPWKF